MLQPTLDPTQSLEPSPKLKNRYSEIIRQTQQSSGTYTDMYTIEPFEIEPHSITHQQVAETIEKWGAFAKIQEKFFAWEFTFQYEKILNIVPENFYTTAIHYLFMKKLSLLMKDFNQNQVLLKSLQLKQIYKLQALSGKLKGKRFDYLLLVTVKLTSFFLGTHTQEIIINRQLEAQLYAILVFALLGTEVGERTYSVILERYMQKTIIKYNGRPDHYKNSIVLPNTSKNVPEMRDTMKQTNRSRKRIGRNQCRTGTALFHQLSHQDDEKQVAEMRQLVKANLVVKEFVPKPKPKETLDAELAKVKDFALQDKELKQAKMIENKQMKRKIIDYTQMSCSLDLNRNNESLNCLHNHSLKIKPEKKSKYYEMIPKQHLRSASFQEQNTPVKLPRIQKPKQEVYSYQAMVQKKMSGNYWKKIIGQMKENKYENIEQFPPISASMYFQQDDQEEDKRHSTVSEVAQTGQRNSHKDGQMETNANLEFLTQKNVETQRAMREGVTQNQLPTMTKLPKRRPDSKSGKKLSIMPILQQLKNQINVIEFSQSTNIKEIYKDKKAFMNVYSSQPLDNDAHKLKKKSYAQLKEYEKKFLDECDQRKEKIEKSHFK